MEAQSSGNRRSLKGGGVSARGVGSVSQRGGGGFARGGGGGGVSAGGRTHPGKMGKRVLAIQLELVFQLTA